MKIHSLFLLSFFSLYSVYAHDESTGEVSRKKNDTIIDSAILRTADGHFVTHDDIGIMLQLREYLRTILYGVKDKSDAVVGPYLFDDTHHCLRTLTMLEKTLDTKIRNTWLTEVRNAFKKRTNDTKKRSEGTKTQQFMYIKESCRIHNRNNSVLLLWAQAPEGQEDDAIDKYVNSFFDMSKFVIDLMNFLDDMISSCPKAKKQFLDKIPDTQERTKLQQLLNHIFEQQKAKISKLKSADA